MATIPLMLDQDVELGELPSYDEATKRQNATGEAPSKQSRHNNIRDAFFREQFAKDATMAGAVAYASISIRLGFLRKVLGILSFQLLLTTLFCVAFYVTPHVRLFLMEQWYQQFTKLDCSEQEE
ncbi:unnamed protein product [Anisakis simplex]|uniref:Transmembrane protein n=1 Tax=Anisakis simplex TaxID=6269 RepID=A0A0M3K9V7_ANISI|nr:unnamed protein product [Anisakis simplex]